MGIRVSRHLWMENFFLIARNKALHGHRLELTPFFSQAWLKTSILNAPCGCDSRVIQHLERPVARVRHAFLPWARPTAGIFTIPSRAVRGGTYLLHSALLKRVNTIAQHLLAVISQRSKFGSGSCFFRTTGRGIILDIPALRSIRFVSVRCSTQDPG
jgi:hypothetical protein